MKKNAYVLGGLLILTSSLSAMVKDPLFVEFEGIRNGISSGHNDAFGGGPQQGANLFKNNIDPRMWDNALNVMEKFVTKIINENKGWWGWGNADADLLNTLNKVVQEGHRLALNIQTIKDTFMNYESLKDPIHVAQALGTIRTIATDMTAIQTKLQPLYSPTPTQPKQLAYNLLYTTSMFIQVTAETVIKHASTKMAEIMKEARMKMQQ